MYSKMVVVTIAALTLGGIIGCGSSKPLTRAELTSQAIAICQDRSTQIAKLRKQHPRDLKGLAIAAVPVFSKSVKGLRDLKPPANIKSAYQRFLAGQQTTLTQAKQIAAGKPVQHIPEATMHATEATIDTLGLTACR